MIGQSYPFMPVLVLFAHDFTEHFVVAGSIGFWSNTWNNAWSVESLECMEEVINDLGIHLHSWETCYWHTFTFHHTHISTDYYFFKLLLFKRIICTLKLWKKICHCACSRAKDHLLYKKTVLEKLKFCAEKYLPAAG